MIESETIKLGMDVITTVGFPIAVTGFLLWERMKRDHTLEKAIDNNTIALKECCTILKLGDKKWD